MLKHDVIRMVVVYENFDAGIRKILDRIVCKLGPGYRIESDLWDFALIGNHSLSEHAATAAREADMIVVAVRNGEELPPPVQDWLEQWASRERSEPVSLVFFHDLGHKDTPLGLFDYMQQLARRGRADFFWYSAGPETETETETEEECSIEEQRPS